MELKEYFINLHPLYLFYCTLHRQPGPGGVLWEVHNSSQTLAVRVQRAFCLSASPVIMHAWKAAGSLVFWDPQK